MYFLKCYFCTLKVYKKRRLEKKHRHLNSACLVQIIRQCIMEQHSAAISYGLWCFVRKSDEKYPI